MNEIYATVCPFVAEIEEKSIDSYAIIAEGKLTFLTDKKEPLPPFKLKGFRTQEAKDLWTEKVEPFLKSS